MNSIQLAQKYQPLLDEIYKKESLTGDLEHGKVKFDGSKVVKILKLVLPSLGEYSRNSGFTSGDVEASWEPWELTQDRGREFSVDAMDDEETLNMTFGNAVSEFIRTKVVPQVDTYRFATMASKLNISTTTGATLSTGADVIGAIRAGMSKMDEDEVPSEGRILYITPTLIGLVEDMDTTKSREVIKSFAKIVKVPQSRFYTACQYNSTTKEIEKTSGAVDINFMIVHPTAVEAVAKHTKLRIFLADGDDGTGANKNQDADAHKFQYRIYHDMFVYDNKVAGIYLHKKGSAQAPANESDNEEETVTTVTISATAGEHGTVSPASIEVASGSTVTISDNVLTCDSKTITATPAEGYVVDAWTGVSNNGTVSEDKSVSVSFKADEQ